MYDAMIAAGHLGLRFVILDRPNPVGGRARGPLLIGGFTSGVGKDKIVQQHGMTAGEIARYFNGVLLPAAGKKAVPDLDVVAVEGWRADELYAATGLPWAADLNGRRLAGVQFHEAYFTPTFSKHVGAVCGGVQVHVLDPTKVDAISVATHMLVALRDRYDAFDWRSGDTPPGRWVDLLTGSNRFRTQFDNGATASEIIAAWRTELAEFERRRRPYLLYRRSR